MVSLGGSVGQASLSGYGHDPTPDIKPRASGYLAQWEGLFFPYLCLSSLLMFALSHINTIFKNKKCYLKQKLRQLFQNIFIQEMFELPNMKNRPYLWHTTVFLQGQRLKVMHVKENTGRLASVVITSSPCTPTTPLRNYIGWAGATLRNGRPHRGTWLAEWLPAQADTTCRMSWPDPPALIFWTLGPRVPKAYYNLLLSPPIYIHPSYSSGSRSPTHPQKHPFPKPLHTFRPPSSPHSPLGLQSFVGSEGTIYSQAQRGRFSFWGGKVASRQNVAFLQALLFSFPAPALVFQLFPGWQDLLYKIQCRCLHIYMYIYKENICSYFYLLIYL